MKHRIPLLLVLAASVGGCGIKYVTPGAGIDIAAAASPRIRVELETEPAASFPSTIAVVRVQGKNYRSYSNTSYGRGSFSVVTSRDIEGPEDFEKLSNLEHVSNIVPLNKLVLPEELKSSKDLRVAAARIKAHMLLMYTIDTSFWVDKKNIGPFAVMMLGFAPKNRAYVTSTASAVLFDTQTGFVYGLAEGCIFRVKAATESGVKATALPESFRPPIRSEKGQERAQTGMVSGITPEWFKRSRAG